MGSLAVILVSKSEGQGGGALIQHPVPTTGGRLRTRQDQTDRVLTEHVQKEKEFSQLGRLLAHSPYV